MKAISRFAAILVVIFSWRPAAADVERSRFCPLPNSPYVAFRGTLDLPNRGLWRVRSASDEAIVQLYSIPQREVDQRNLGRRMKAALDERRNNQAQWRIRSLRSPLLQYAQRHDGVGPETVQQLDDSRYEFLIENFDRSPWPDLQEVEGKEIEGPFMFLVPRAQFHFADDRQQRIAPERREVLIVELRPYINDGQHWVLYTDGTCQREPIKKELVAAHGLEVKPVLEITDPPTVRAEDTVRYQLIAVRRNEERDPFEVTLWNPIVGEERSHPWDPGDAELDEGVLASLNQARTEAWQPYLRTGPAPVLRTWQSQTSATSTDPRPEDRPGNRVSMFALLGGRAAVEETLQLQVLRSSAKQDAAETVAISSLPGVRVKAHPFEQMLAGQPGGQLPLAEAAPPDRLFVYVAQPEAILPFLDHGAGFLAGTGAMISGNRLDYDLTHRYLERLGITRSQLETIIRSGAVQELAVIVPDLFLIDGTEMTVVARLAQPQFLAGLLQLFGTGPLTGQGIVTVKTAGDRSAFWALRGELLCLSSNRDELQRVLQHVDDEGAGSLGRSAEFRYMLTQLPVTDQTRVYAYFSDPFIRRLVGPEVKLKQARRVQSRARMEYLTAKMLRARLDGVSAASVGRLRETGYLPDTFPAEEYSISPQGQVTSDVYGSLARIDTLPNIRLERVTPDEAEAYREYVEEYERYWRQFFDPIALRLADTPQGTLELTTFILPLIDSSVYDRLRQAILHAESRRPLTVPQLEPAPVLQFSANLSDQSWQQITNGFADFFTRYAQVSPALLDDLGPGLHLAVHDADPVIALGSGDLMGAFGSNVLRNRGSEMIMLPVMLSIFTRPCTVLLETQDAARTTRLLRQAAIGWRPPERLIGREFQVSFYQIADRDEWVWTMDIVGVVKLRFGIEVVDRFLVLRNIPWSADDRIVGSRPSAQNGAQLTLTPAACRLQLPGLFAAAADQERQAVIHALGRLYPLLISGATDPEAAAQEHQRLFGFRPVSPSGDEWVWQDYEVFSSIYGSASRQQQPRFDPNQPFGLLHGVQQMQLSMQLEDTGLRSTVVWKYDP